MIENVTIRFRKEYLKAILRHNVDYLVGWDSAFRKSPLALLLVLVQTSERWFGLSPP